MSAPIEDFDDRNALYAMYEFFNTLATKYTLANLTSTYFRRYNLLVSTMNKDGSLVHRQMYVYSRH
jgi:hypothetical protein